MNRYSRAQIRTIIVLGFALSALSWVISFINDVNSIGYVNSFHGTLNSLVGPLAGIAAVCAWSLLTRLEAHDEKQLRIMRLAYLFFAAEYLLISIGYNFIFTPIHSFGGFWTTTSLWLEFVGTLTAAIGLFLMSRSLATIAERERPKVIQH
jgi:hypothetical protein